MARTLGGRRARAGVALALGAALLPSCAGGGGDAVRLQVFGDGAEIAAYRELIAAYERANPGADVELVAVPSQSDHMAKLATAFAGGDPPDLFIVNYRRFGQLAGKGVIEPFGAHLAEAGLHEADFYPQALAAFRVDGTLLCMPQNISSLVVYWNRALFRAAGVAAPRAGWTWQEFLDAATRLTHDTDGDGRADVHGAGTEPTLIRLTPFIWQAGGELVDDTENPTQITLLGPEAVRAMTFFINLRRVHKVSPSVEEAESEDYETRFAAGRLAMLIESRRATTDLRGVSGLDWDVAPLPRDREAATVLHSDAYCVAKASRRRAAALRFVGFALGREGATILARSGRTVPSLRAVAESPAFLDPSMPPASGRVFLDAIPLIRRVPNIETWHEIETRGDKRVDEWYYGTERPEALGIEIRLATLELFAATRPTAGPRPSP